MMIGRIGYLISIEPTNWLHLALWLVAFGIHQIFGSTVFIFSCLVSSYLDPFIFGMLICFLYTREPVLLMQSQNLRSLTFREYMAILIVLGMVSELVFPALSSKFRADAFDILAIAGGIVYYHFLFRKFD
jgi:hypothetical protein